MMRLQPDHSCYAVGKEYPAVRVPPGQPEISFILSLIGRITITRRQKRTALAGGAAQSGLNLE